MRLKPDTLRALAREYRETVRAVTGEENFATVLDQYGNQGRETGLAHESEFCDTCQIMADIWTKHAGEWEELSDSDIEDINEIYVTAFPCKQAGEDQ